MIRSLYIILSLILIVISCDSNKELNELQSAMNLFDFTHIPNSTIYVYYGFSCRSCSKNVIRFINSSLSNSNDSSFHLFTNVKSIKEVDNYFGYISTDPRVVVDLKDRFYKIKFSKNFRFPIIMRLENGIIVEVESLPAQYFL